MINKKLSNIKKTSIGCLAAIVASTAMTNSAMANPSDTVGPYVSGYYGGYKSRGGDFDDENDLYELGIGYRFLPFLGVELSYTDLGDFGGDAASAEVDGYALSAVGTLPISDRFELYAEVGQLFVKTQVQVLGFKDSLDDETLFFGLGASFRVTDPLWLKVEYQRYNVDVNDESWPIEIDDDDADIDTLKIGASYHF